MYAVIKTGGKQYKVAAGEKLKVEQIPADVGSSVALDHVLLVANGDNITVGTPLVSGAKVNATVVSHGRGDKVRIFKMRRRKHYQKHGGHRQNYTELYIASILGAGGALVAEAKALSAAPVAAAASTAKRGKAVKGQTKGGLDDLEIVEGIGPKIAGLLRADGIDTFAKLAAASQETLKGILHKAGSRYNIADPTTWPEQSKLAAEGNWDALQALQDKLDGGRR